MSVTLRIYITKEVLKESKTCTWEACSSNCAIAVAVRGIFPEAKVGVDYIHPYGRPDICKIPLPPEARQFIKVFDSLRWTTPEKRLDLPEFEFDITVSDEIINSIPLPDLSDCLTVKKLVQDETESLCTC